MTTPVIAGMLATWCLGRFTLALPPLPILGRADTVQGLAAQVMAADGKSPEQLWQERLAQLQMLRPPAGRTTAVLRMPDLAGGLGAGGLGPGGFGNVVYFGNEFAPDRISVETGQALPPRLVLFTATVPPDQEPGAAAHVDQVAGALHALPAGTPSATAFCLGEGAVFLPPAGPEGTTLTLESDDARTHIEVTIQTVARPKEIDRESAYDEIEHEAGKRNLEMQRLRRGPRAVAGLDGFEAVYRVVEGDEPALHGSWEFPGVGDHSADQPFISIKAKFPYDAAMLSEWDRILSSMHYNMSAPR